MICRFNALPRRSSGVLGFNAMPSGKLFHRSIVANVLSDIAQLSTLIENSRMDFLFQ
jgi:hypothetical protein